MVRVPVAGEPVTIDWARSVSQEIRACRILPGVGYSIEQSSRGVRLNLGPRIKQQEVVASEATLEPFTVRWHTTGKDTNGQLEVYLPFGSMTTTDDCKPINTPASATRGHDEERGWYAIELSEDAKQHSIAVYVMHGEHMIAVDRGAEIAKKYEDGAFTKISLCTFNSETKVIDGSNLGKKLMGLYSNISNTVCRLRYTLERDEVTKKRSVSKVEMVNCVFKAGGIILVADDIEVPESATSAWMKINHDYSGYSLEIVFDPSDTKDSDDYTYMKLYDLKNRYVTTDYRLSPNNILFLY
jgi:hypothetical protein